MQFSRGYFSNTTRIERYALEKHKKTVGRGKLLDKLRYFDKELEGVNENNTDYTKAHSTKIEEKLKPLQHPRNMDDLNTAIIAHKVPPKNLTPYDHIPLEALAQLDLKCENSPMGSRFIQSCILGAPNAGKSSLINLIVGKNVSAVSNKYNTTDEATKGIFTNTEKKTQMALIDTPGVTKASNSLRSKLLVTRAWE